MSGSSGKGKPARGKKGEGSTIIVRREEGGGHGHHGGAWKVAYADFVTAMMAFFLLMWLLKATTEEQRRGLADYFSPTNVFGRSMSGSGAPFAGSTPNVEGTMVSNMGSVRVENGPRPAAIDIEEDDSDVPAQPSLKRDGGEFEHLNAVGGQAEKPAAGSGQSGQAEGGASQTAAPNASKPVSEQPAAGSLDGVAERELRQELARRERADFEQATDHIRQAVGGDPSLADLARQLRIEQVPEGLRIQLIDAERQPMFAIGVGAPNDRGRALLQKVAQVIVKLPNAVAISGHTDATPFRGGDRSNWDLSAERAQATRRLLLDGGVAEGRIRSISGNADRDLLMADDPTAAANRRVSVLLIRQIPDAESRSAATTPRPAGTRP